LQLTVPGRFGQIFVVAVNSLASKILPTALASVEGVAESPPSLAQNIGFACADGQDSATVAMRWLSSSGARLDVSYGQLAEESARFANVLQSLGIVAGDSCFILLPKIPEVFYAFLGTLKARAIACPLFIHFGEPALQDRLSDGQARVLVTRQALLKKVGRIRGKLPTLRHVLVVDSNDDIDESTLSLPRLMRAASPHFEVAPTSAETPSLLHYTSGSTGKPKGVLHVHGALSLQRETTEGVLGVHPGDVFWCTADPGWVTGTAYGIIGPWSLGVTQVHYHGAFDADTWMTILEQEAVNVWYTAPTALRMLMREDPSLFRDRKLQALRHIASVGEPLNPEIVHWGRQVLGKEIHDTWFQTETGAIMIANRPGIPIRPGSMGKPVSGIEAAILDRTGRPLPPGHQGRLCLRAGWASMFRQYLHRPDAYAGKLDGGYYDSGDTAVCDQDGYYWFVGRADDVINTTGHLVGPFEIESALLEMADVVESAAIGAPDPIRFEKVVVFVVLRAGIAPSREVESRIRLHLANRVSSFAAPQNVVFVDEIPKNNSGKIMRRLLRARFLGQDVGDLSTLAPSPAAQPDSDDEA
jgi:acetyl-CoA synthetase